jgi:hypothetical protein
VKRRLVTLAAAIIPSTLTLFAVPLRAGAQATTQPGGVVGSVCGKVINSRDIGLTAPIDLAVQFDARDSEKWQLMGRIMRTFGRPVVERFVEERKIEATAAEIELFKRNSRKGHEQNLREKEDRLAKVKTQLTSSDVSAQESARLQEERAMLERLVPALRQLAKEGAPEQTARTFIIGWKIERELHRTYGGRVIFQQAGPEALDARRMLFEEAEKQGHLKFDDPAVRHMFYYYANMQHTVVDAKALERPWFLEE